MLRATRLSSSSLYAIGDSCCRRSRTMSGMFSTTSSTSSSNNNNSASSFKEKIKLFREIVWPETMPNPPDYKHPRKYTLREHFTVWTKACDMYYRTWVTTTTKKTENNDTGLKETTTTLNRKTKTTGTNSTEAEEEGIKTKTKEPNVEDEMKELVRVTKAGGWRPLVKHLYETRGIAYRDGVREFIKAYKEGYREAVDSFKDDDADYDNHAIAQDKKESTASTTRKS